MRDQLEFRLALRDQMNEIFDTVERIRSVRSQIAAHLLRLENAAQAAEHRDREKVLLFSTPARNQGFAIVFQLIDQNFDCTRNREQQQSRFRVYFA